MSERDDAGPQDDRRAETDDSAHDVSADEAREIDAGVRALRDEPVASEQLARMRAGLDAKIAAAEVSGGAGGEAVPIDVHPRFGRRMLGAAAAIAAAVLLALWIGRSGEMTGERAPRRVADDAPPIEIEGDAPREQIADAGGEAEFETTGEAMTQIEPEPEPEPELAGEARTQTELDLEAASDEELALAIEYDQLTDYDVIAQLDLLELLDAMEADGRI